MKFNVEEAVNGFTVKVDDDEAVHVAKNAKDVAKIIGTALGHVNAPAKVRKPRKSRKPRGQGKKKAAAAAANADTLSGLNQ